MYRVIPYPFLSLLLPPSLSLSLSLSSFPPCRYPVILSIENHCGILQQHHMADIMDEIFGDMLFKAQRDEESHLLPSPNQLKHKILIKVKRLIS